VLLLLEEEEVEEVEEWVRGDNRRTLGFGADPFRRTS